MEYSFIEMIGLILVLGFVAFFIISMYLKNTKGNYKADVFSERKKAALPVKLQAYERMILFCERINPIKLLVRVKPVDSTSDGYLQLILKSIEQEFEHNLAQQLYLSDECWNVIITSKTATINKLKQVADTCESAQDVREKMMLEYQNTVPPTETAIAFIKSEVKKII